jgi:3-phenylpropionate/cinnamic acid dioxygenase small subunit
MTPEDVREAQHDIAEVLVAYATGIDRRDWQRFRSCFTADVIADYGDVGSWQGVDAITDFMTQVHAGMGHTLHRLSNIAIEVADDGATAFARSYVDNENLVPDGATGIHTTGFYDDELVKTVAGWKISQRRFTLVRSTRIN